MTIERRYAIARVRQVAAMVFFGAAVGILLTFLGGLMAIDYVPKCAAGAALSVVCAIAAGRGTASAAGRDCSGARRR